MSQPEGFHDPTHSNYVCHLDKVLYGLKQSLRAWYNKLSSFLLTWGFVNSSVNSSMFTYCHSTAVLVVLVYVDDIILTGSNPSLIAKLLSNLRSTFAIKDLGQLHYILGIQVHHSAAGLHLNQHKYIQDLLHRAEMLDSKIYHTPMTTATVFSAHDGTPLPDGTQYRSIVSALQYFTMTLPDISFAVNHVCQYMHSPSDTHWQAVKRILCYLKGTAHHGLLLQPCSEFNLLCYTDADWASCLDDRRSTGAYYIFLGHNIISWSSSKQRVVSRSSTESEFRALADGVAELSWIQFLLRDLRMQQHSAPLLLCDNISTTYLTANPVLHARTKHVEIDFYFIRERVASKQLVVRFTPSEDQLADALTKALPSARFLQLRSKLTVVPPPMSLRGDDKSCT
ncbi:uncharacterized mitochondrial protein AtMg00810-like [Humulus lupulus]|uniref:uncharacterized mitochondrial protein AtMg00810-like n=1 Tax=Humulus lupulus TaxID=3486 RepID=UPI002B405A58|nr:uncharacterized mitochondrial protein AtMg00810-like [Humulus lupulus]